MNKILVIGEICIDEYIYGSCDRVCPEAAALCFKRNRQTIKTNFGMAGNVFNNIKSLDSIIDVSILGSNTSVQPIIKRRFIDSRYNTIVFREDINDFSDRVKLPNSLQVYKTIVISDYDKGFIDYSDYEKIKELADPKTIIIADTKKKITPDIAKYIDILKINHSEYQQNISNIQAITNHCKIIVTKGSDGCILIENNTETHFKTKPIEIRDVCGAGDTFLAGLATRLFYDKPIQEAIIFANEKAGLVVQKFGVTTP